jgi:hypothetical protein
VYCYYLANKKCFNKTKNTHKGELKFREFILRHKEDKGDIIIAKVVTKIVKSLLD